MSFHDTSRLALHYSFIFILLGLLTACGGGAEDSHNATITLSGSVGDGPIIGATLTITDANGQVLVSAESDSTANYEVEFPATASYPLIITATDGTDLVTGVPPTFAMVSTVFDPSIVTTNINPFSTLIVKTAQAMPGGLNSTNLDVAKQNILQHLNFGIDGTLMPDPITTPVTEQNVANIVKASEAFAEAIRRTNAELLAIGTSINEDQLIDALAADMTDGQLDGIGAENANPLFSATANVISGQVLIEALSNNLYVNGAWATDLLDNAILITMPTATETTANVAVTAEMINQTKLAIDAAQAAAPNETLSSIAIVLDNLSPGSKAADITLLLPADKSNDLEQAITSLALLTDNELEAVNRGSQGAGTTSEDDIPLFLAWNSNTDILGYIVYYGSTPETAINIASDTSTTSVRIMRKTDLGLNPGDNVCFRLKAYNGHALSGFSAAACGTV